jgi:TetR/AcrR family transcriptional repressor of nem operon
MKNWSMGDIYHKIIDAAEKRMRIGGFKGFSYRDIAADVGLRNASIHHHFPTKEKLAAEVIRFYTKRFSDDLESELARCPDPVKTWVRVFRKTITPENHVCPCVVLGPGSQDLPEELSNEVRNFFKMQTDKLQAAGLTERMAAKLLASIVGALSLTAMRNDLEVYDSVTSHLTRETIGDSSDIPRQRRELQPKPAE